MPVLIFILIVSLIARLEKRAAGRRTLPALSGRSEFVLTQGSVFFRNSAGQTMMIKGQVQIRKEFMMNAYRTTNALAPCRGVVGGVIEDPPDPPDEDDGSMIYIDKD